MFDYFLEFDAFGFLISPEGLLIWSYYRFPQYLI
jgi:hypothetical protein